MEADRCFTSPLKQEVPYSSDLVLFLNGVATFFNPAAAVPRSAIPLTLKTAQISVSALQHSERCYKF